MIKTKVSVVLILLGICSYFSPVYAQREITLDEAETLFRQKNGELISVTHRATIEADANLEEAKKFDNPELSIDQVNLWSTSGQREGEKEVIPPIVGHFGKNTEFSLGLSQTFRLGGKRRKKVREEKLNREIVGFSNQEVTNDLLFAFKEEVFALNYAKEYAKILEKQQTVFATIIKSYEKQQKQGFISSSELLRVQAEKLQIEKELNEVKNSINSTLKDIQSKLGDGENEITDIRIPESDGVVNRTLGELYALSAGHPVLQKGISQIDFSKKKLTYEKSLRIPDMTFSANYDRAGGVWKNFIGFGVSFTLPVFNRNQANIKAAKRFADLANYEQQQQTILVQNKIRSSFENYQQTLDFYEKLGKESAMENLDNLLVKYQNNIIKKNISLIEFIDFMETYKNSKNMLLETQRDLFVQKCALEVTVGTKLK